MNDQEIAKLHKYEAELAVLIDGISAILGSAGKLEDAVDELRIEIDRAENPCLPHCKCDACVAARSDEHHDRKPCPFCGGEAKEDFIDGSIWCTKCPGGVTDFTLSRDLLRNAWNNRSNLT